MATIKIPPVLRPSVGGEKEIGASGGSVGEVLRDGRAVGYERGRNAEASPYRFRLEVEPEVWFLEDDGYELAVFHSHPTSAPRPSRADLERAGLWASRPWLILRTDTRELAAWRIEDGRAREVTIA